MTSNDEIRDIFAEIEGKHNDKEIKFPCKQCLFNGIKKGFEAGQKSSQEEKLFSPEGFKIDKDFEDFIRRDTTQKILGEIGEHYNCGDSKEECFSELKSRLADDKPISEGKK